MPAAALTAGLPLPGAPASHQPAVIAIPGTSSTHTARRSATNPRARLSAYVVRDASLENSPHSALTVAIKSNGRYLGLSLKGHGATIVDLEFLATTPEAPVHVLGSCDEDGIVYLWFLYVEKDSLNVDVALKLLRKYSFYSMRRSRTAFYSRIRLHGSSENGTMVLVPNDGSNVRVVTFHCEPSSDSDGKPNMPVIAPPPKTPELPAPEMKEVQHEEQKHEEQDIEETKGQDEQREHNIEEDEIAELKETERDIVAPMISPYEASTQQKDDEEFVDARGDELPAPDPPTDLPEPPLDLPEPPTDLPEEPRAARVGFVEDVGVIHSQADGDEEPVAMGGAQAVDFVEEEELESDVEEYEDEEYDDEEEAAFEAQANGQVAGF